MTTVKGQPALVVKYVDDRINESTYLDFKSNHTFEYHYLYDSMGDAATGTYRLHRDTIFLKYAPNASDLEERFITHTEALRADTLLIKGNLLYEVKNGVSREYEPRDTVHYKPPRHWHYRRKYIYLVSISHLVTQSTI
ncbi:hypothetical protein [Mucilaginibacter sp. CSA2-8R]|uniref:hypothetical protein n=1 Tax=Mucilaginibacter sp. CSA2-8R TaxID=3141542 RepID=UPI00315D408F